MLCDGVYYLSSNLHETFLSRFRFLLFANKTWKKNWNLKIESYSLLQSYFRRWCEDYILLQLNYIALHWNKIALHWNTVVLDANWYLKILDSTTARYFILLRKTQHIHYKPKGKGPKCGHPKTLCDDWNNCESIVFSISFDGRRWKVVSSKRYYMKRLISLHRYSTLRGMDRRDKHNEEKN